MLKNPAINMGMLNTLTHNRSVWQKSASLKTSRLSNIYSVFFLKQSLKDEIDVRVYNKGNPENVQHFNCDGWFTQLIAFINTPPPPPPF